MGVRAVVAAEVVEGGHVRVAGLPLNAVREVHHHSRQLSFYHARHKIFEIGDQVLVAFNQGDIMQVEEIAVGAFTGGATNVDKRCNVSMRYTYLLSRSTKLGIGKNWEYFETNEGRLVDCKTDKRRSRRSSALRFQPTNRCSPWARRGNRGSLSRRSPGRDTRCI